MNPPTLSELIEAVREKKEHYFHLILGEEWSCYEKDDGLWDARYYPNTQVGFTDAKGRTPEEAVAKLWLALQNTK